MAIANYSPLNNTELQFLSGDATNSTRCTNITILDDMITGSTIYFNVSISTNDSAVHVVSPSSTTVAIQDSDRKSI